MENTIEQDFKALEQKVRFDERNKVSELILDKFIRRCNDSNNALTSNQHYILRDILKEIKSE